MLNAHHAVVVGAGFGGLEAVHRLAGAPVRITIVDRRNHHLFQPLLYQAATASLAPSEIGAVIGYALLCSLVNDAVKKMLIGQKVDGLPLAAPATGGL